MSQTDNAVVQFPRTWAADTAYVASGGLRTLLSAIGAAHEIIQAQVDYTRLQTRIATATDSNLDQIASDYLGVGSQRTETLVPGTTSTLQVESDPAFSERIRNTIIAPQVTVPGIQALLTQWIATYYLVDYVLNVRLLGLDTAGGLDSWGGLDGRATSNPGIPTVTVFDLQSDPTRAAKIALQPSQFCILLTYGGITRDGFFVGRVHLHRSDHLVSDKLRSVPPITTAFDAYVRKIKAAGSVPVYYDNRG